MFNRVFVALWLAFFSATLGLGMVSPILPLFAQQLGARGVSLGLAFSGFALVQMLATPFTGRLSDRGGRKWLILTGLAVYAAVGLGYHAVSHLTPLLALRFLSGAGTSLVFPLTVAYIGELAPPGREGTYMGIFSIADVTGFGLGPLLGGALRAAFGFGAVFLAMSGLVALAALAVALFVPALPASHHGATTPKAASLRRYLRHPLLQTVFLTRLVWSIAEGASYSFLAVLIAGRLGAGPILVGLALSTRDLVTGACQPVMGRLADRLERLRMVPVGLALLALLQFLLPHMPSYLLLLAVLVAAGVATSLFWAAASALQVEAGRDLGMGTVMGAMETAVGAGILAGSILGGLAADAIGISGPFIVAGCCGLAATAVFPALSRRIRTTAVLPA
jgi:DHA1 family multidrug resistance protein-like MFS transporter